MRNVFILIILSLSLQGCFCVGAAVGAAGVAAAYDHRKVKQVVEDQNIANHIATQIHSNPAMQGTTHIEVSSYNGVILLTGEATSGDLRQQASDIAQNYPGVQKVHNQITIKGPTSALTQTSDAWITTKIKSQMLATKELKSRDIKVVTENGSVYLMGKVSHRQADMAVDVARKVSGVQRVMKAFQYND